MIKIVALIAIALTLSACQSSSHISTQNTDLMARYQGLTLTEAEDGVDVLRTVNPRIHEYSFDRLVLDSVVMQPTPPETEEVPIRALEDIVTYLDTRLRNALEENHQLLSQSNPGVPRMKVVLTGVKLDSEGLKVTELLPYGAAIGLIRTATGTRNQEVTILVEIEVTDSVTGEILFAAIRAGQGDNIRVLWSPELTLSHVQTLLDEWVNLAASQLAAFSVKKAR